MQNVAKTESDFDAKAVSPKGAIGVMQLVLETAKALGADPSGRAALRLLYSGRCNVPSYCCLPLRSALPAQTSLGAWRAPPATPIFIAGATSDGRPYRDSPRRLWTKDGVTGNLSSTVRFRRSVSAKPHFIIRTECCRSFRTSMALIDAAPGWS